MRETIARELAEILAIVARRPSAVAPLVGVELHPGQRRFLDAPPIPTLVLVTGRRWGKTMAAALSILAYALTRADFRQCVVSVTLDQAQLTWRYLEDFLARSPVLNVLVADVKQQPFPTLRFKNGAEVTVRAAAREGVYLRGHRFDRVVVDEADYVPERVITEAIRMTLADTGGQLVLLTTPRVTRGYVYRLVELARSGDPTVLVQTGSTLDNPYLDHRYIEALRAQVPEVVWRREVEGVYVDDTGTLFRFEDVTAAYDSAGWLLPEEPIPGRHYVQGVDLAKERDWTVQVVLDVTEQPFRLVAYERHRNLPWTAIVARIRHMHERYACVRTLVDATGVGAVVLDELADIAQGVTFTPRTKADLITGLGLALERRTLRFPFVRELVDELLSYRLDDEGLVTDSVFALALAVRAAYAAVAEKPILFTVDWTRLGARDNA